MKSAFSFVLLLLLLAGPATGADEARKDPPPPLPEEYSDEDGLPEPEVRIIQKEDRTIEEFSVNGQLRYVKITPKKGPPYYIVDTDGDGVLDQQFNNLDNPPINKWILLEW